MDRGSLMDQNDEPSVILRPSYDNLWNLISIWDEMGIDQQQRDKRLKRAQEMLTSLVQDLISEEMETKRMVMERIEDLRRRIKDLCNELGVPPGDNTLEETSSMVKQEKVLHSCMTQLRQARQKRMSRYESLQQQDLSLSERLGKSPRVLVLSDGRLPTTAEIDELENHVTFLNEQAETRIVEVRRLRDTLTDVLKELEIDEPDDFESWSLFTNDVQTAVSFPLTDNFISRLSACVARYCERRDTAENQCKHLLSSIEQLWNRLGTSEADKQLFLCQLPASKPASLHLLEAEVTRLKELKKANMERFLEECKVELRQWWERCFIPIEEQHLLENEESDDDLTDYVENLENEVSRLKQYYEQNKAAFDKVIEWNLAFEKLKITEQRMKDPSVLSNRGGVLLKYDKTKRATLRQMKSLETSLGSHIATQVEGQPVLAYIENRRRAYEAEKENEKRERQEKHSNLLQKEMRFGSKPVVTPTSKKRILSTTQRHMNTTSVNAVNNSIHPKLRKIDTAAEQFRRKLTSACNTPTPDPRTPQHSITRSVFRTPTTAPRSAASSARVSLAKRRQSRLGPPSSVAPIRPVPFDVKSLVRTPRRRDAANVTATTTYSEFAQDVNSNPQARSSIGQSVGSQSSSHRTPRH